MFHPFDIVIDDALSSPSSSKKISQELVSPGDVARKRFAGCG